MSYTLDLHQSDNKALTKRCVQPCFEHTEHINYSSLLKSIVTNTGLDDMATDILSQYRSFHISITLYISTGILFIYKVINQSYKQSRQMEPLRFALDLVYV